MQQILKTLDRVAAKEINQEMLTYGKKKFLTQPYYRLMHLTNKLVMKLFKDTGSCSQLGLYTQN